MRMCSIDEQRALEFGERGEAKVSREEVADADDAFVDQRSRKRQIVEFILINACGFMWFADNAILPAVYRELKETFGVTLTQLGTMTFARGLMEALASFPVGFAADVQPRPKLILCGVLLWGMGIIACGMASQFWMLFAGRVMNGIGLGIVQPLLYSLISDLTPPSRRGSAFGTLQFIGNTGSMAGAFFAATFAEVVFMGMAGWRMVLVAFGMISIVIGMLVGAVIKDPREGVLKKVSVFAVVKEKWPEMVRIFKIPSFLTIIAQGGIGSSPWYSFSFLTLWLELLCFSNSEAADINSIFVLGQAFGGIIGGKVLDAVCRLFPKHGPPSVCQVSVGIGLPMTFIIFFVMDEDSPQRAYFAMFMAFGMLISWAGIVNNKIFGDIVPQEIYPYIYGLDRCIEGAVGSLGSLATGYITNEYFDFDPSTVNKGSCSPTQAHKLGEGIFTVCFVSWVVCFIFYSGLHITYPKDRLAFKQSICLEDGSDAGSSGEETSTSEDN
eukprot:TRINITY_DN24840_c0_g1_i1.p1 TRINITY_DN24840_c0_g1~~TRINITY_DN24840_c0_g1_i1.p1  ORF type:complete len:497 (-),score=89.52 TRINITY_DN24840_c0_g1_i1:763-2253(-)